MATSMNKASLMSSGGAEFSRQIKGTQDRTLGRVTPMEGVVLEPGWGDERGEGFNKNERRLRREKQIWGLVSIWDNLLLSD